ncbi:MAG: hypothetical protein HY040_22335 [Planctomycetes bacterium]|nr:hypothetical protein [Planctomycetota bacterium]
MIEFRHPEKKAYSHVVSVAFLDNVAHDSRCKDELESRPWKFVVLQAQKISMSGKHSYSQKVGIDIAKLAKAKGAIVCFYSEWARKGVAGERERTEKIYQEMADAADVKVALVSKAWELALSERPDLPLHAGDGNHQSALGAFLTACVLYAKITGESPAALAAFPYPDAAEDDRKFLAEIAASLSPGGRFVPK